MGISNFPNGFKQGIAVRGIPIVNTHPGEVFWVNNSGVLAKGGVGGSDGNDGTYQRPYSTIDKALDAATASRGDVILVMPGHAETVATDGGLAFDKAGVAVIGLGVGTLRPTISLSTLAAAAITVTAANVTLSNFRIVANFADITNAIDVTATNLHLDRIEFIEGGADLNFLDYIACTGGDGTANNLTVTDCIGTAIDAAQNSFLNITGDLDRLVFMGNFYSSTTANTLAMILCATGKDLTDCRVENNRMYTLATAGDLLIDNDTTANTGIVAWNLIGHADTAGEVLIDADGVRQFENRGTATDTASGYVLPALDS
jgi:hypothetical protein